ncbi:MAG: 2Fe-2S iron-sulfur cluster-binding protein [Planctomycetota bacterium]|nr:2Fe-2S iron-sulfur cluster-binding protein [Planctomycetota bacterium]MDG1983358.1 2Fe-2S iron-sulfur cluster-binding protein [Planctomycetota bacterium]
MGGINPYQEQVETPLPDQTYSVTFLPMGKTVSVDPKALPLSREGKPGSILDIADGNGIEIDHACGGVCACSTCHVIIREGVDSIPEASESEEDMLDEAPGVELTSRLACQAVPSGATNVTVEIPGWNRNHARETH